MPPAPGVAYRAGDPIPPGYHPEQRARSGFVTGGILLTAIPYGIGLLGVVAADYSNSSAWLGLPWVEPWLHLGLRRYESCDRDKTGKTTGDAGKCIGDAFLMMGLIVDGILQTGGAALLLVGVLKPKTVLVLDEQALHVMPMRIGSGYGAGLSGTL